MSFQFHHDAKVRFDQQYFNTQQYVIPFIESRNFGIPLQNGMKVLEIGCGEGGVLKAFTDKGCIATGVDLLGEKVDLGKPFLQEELQSKKITFLIQNVYDDDFKKKFQNYFDLIILKDTIEHIPNQEKMIDYLKIFLKENGKIFFGFPPWYMPFGGHQQLCSNKILSLLPYYHLLPNFLYRTILNFFEEKDTVNELMDIKSTGISIERFEKIVRSANYKILRKKFYLINPIYEYKFKLKPKEQFSSISAIPYLRDFFTTCVYYLIERK